MTESAVDAPQRETGAAKLDAAVQPAVDEPGFGSIEESAIEPSLGDRVAVVAVADDVVVTNYAGQATLPVDCLDLAVARGEMQLKAN